MSYHLHSDDGPNTIKLSSHQHSLASIFSTLHKNWINAEGETPIPEASKILSIRFDLQNITIEPGDPAPNYNDLKFEVLDFVVTDPGTANSVFKVAFVAWITNFTPPAFRRDASQPRKFPLTSGSLLLTIETSPPGPSQDPIIINHTFNSIRIPYTVEPDPTR